MDTKTKLHRFIDDCWDAWDKNQGQAVVTAPAPPAPKPDEEPKDKRVVRTKTTMDKVYLIDETKKTRQWITSPKVLESLGFILQDVKEMPDEEFIKYAQGAPVYNVPVNTPGN